MRLLRRLLSRALVRTVPLDRLPGRMLEGEWRVRAPEVFVETPETASMPLRPELHRFRAPRVAAGPAAVRRLRDVLLCMSGHVLLGPRRRVIAESVSTRTAPLDVRPLYRRVAGRLDGVWAPLRSVRNGHYHTLVDNLPRLWALHGGPAADEAEIRVPLGGPPSPVEQYLLGRLLPPNARVAELDPAGVFRAERVLFSRFLTRRFCGALPPACLAWFRERAVPPGEGPRRRLLLQRRPGPARGRRLIRNADELAAALAPLGFEVLEPETLSPAEQAVRFRDADVIVGAHGAGLANMVFCRSARVVELFPTRSVIPHYYFLARSLGFAYDYWCAGSGGRDAAFRVDPAAVRRLVESLEPLSVPGPAPAGGEGGGP